MKLRVLIADPDPDLQRTITAALSQERDMEAAGFSSGGRRLFLKSSRCGRMWCCWSSFSRGSTG